LLEPEYDDGMSTPRRLGVSKNPLPNPRFISRLIQSDNELFEKVWSHLFTIFGQFLVHDITSLSISSGNL
jgi:hypothetical protein